MIRRHIPAPTIAAVADLVSVRYTHSGLDSLLMHAGAPGDPPQGNKQAKVIEWLRRTNDDRSVDPLSVLGKVIEECMEEDGQDEGAELAGRRAQREKLEDSLSNSGLQYGLGGRILSGLSTPSKNLHEIIRLRQIPSIDEEFTRALDTVTSKPRDAVSAAANILEAICKVYIDDEGLRLPSKQDLPSVWSLVRKDLGFDPGRIEDDDLKEVLSGLLAIVSGIGKLRTHAGSAHAQGRKVYKLEPRHARLAVHSAHTVALFILESWDRRRA